MIFVALTEICDETERCIVVNAAQITDMNECDDGTQISFTNGAATLVKESMREILDKISDKKQLDWSLFSERLSAELRWLK